MKKYKNNDSISTTTKSRILKKILISSIFSLSVCSYSGCMHNNDYSLSIPIPSREAILSGKAILLGEEKLPKEYRIGMLLHSGRREKFEVLQLKEMNFDQNNTIQELTKKLTYQDKILLPGMSRMITSRDRIIASQEKENFRLYISVAVLVGGILLYLLGLCSGQVKVDIFDESNLLS